NLIALRCCFPGIAGGLRPFPQFLALGAQRESVGLDRSEMRPACDQCHLLAGQRQLRAQQAADGAGAVNADLHAVSPSLAARPMRCSLPVAPFGISARNTIFRGTLKSARCDETQSR